MRTEDAQRILDAHEIDARQRTTELTPCEQDTVGIMGAVPQNARIVVSKRILANRTRAEAAIINCVPRSRVSPEPTFEAGKPDGCEGSKLLRYVTLPLLSPSLFFNIVLASIVALRVFDAVHILPRDPTPGGD